MKKTLLIALFALLGLAQAVAQEYEYAPFVREGVKWVCYYDRHDNFFPPTDIFFNSGKNYFILEMSGDTVINGNSYKAIHKYSGAAIDPLNDTILLYVREENKIVYGIAPEGHFYPGFVVGYGYGDGSEHPYYESIFLQAINHEELILYNFNDPENYYDLIFWRDRGGHAGRLKYIANDTIQVGDRLAKKHVFNRYEDNFYIIESVGFDSDDTPGYLLAYLFNHYPCPPYWLSHVVQNGTIIYKGVHYDPNIRVGIDEVVEDKVSRPLDPRYYDLMGRAVGTEVPTTPGIYIHQGKKIVVR